MSAEIVPGDASRAQADAVRRSREARRNRPERRAWERMAAGYPVRPLADIDVNGYGAGVWCTACNVGEIFSPSFTEYTIAGAVLRAADAAETHNRERHARRLYWQGETR